MSILNQINQELVQKMNKSLPEIHPGDTLKIQFRVQEADGKERLQAYEGLCIALKRAGINTSITVRKISYGEGVERIVPVYSPVVHSIEVIRRGKVRRAKLYYLRDLSGKSARIFEKTTGNATRDRDAKVSE